MTIDEHKRLAPDTLGFAVVTVSSSRAGADDKSGDRIQELIEAAGHRVESTLLVPDAVVEIRQAVRGLLVRPEVEVVVLTGGTGFSPGDLTVEAVRPLLEREVEGFGELFRYLSFQQVGAAAMLSRATAGLVGDRAVFVLPGSPKAVELAMEGLILPEAAHLLGQARRQG